MSVRVNLLKPEELRQQNSVNREAVVRMATMVGAAAAAAAVIFGVLQYRGVIQGNSRAKAEFATIGEMYEQVKGMRDTSNFNARYVGELTGWSNARFERKAMFQALRTLVPENIQVTRLVISGDIHISALEPGDEETPGTPGRGMTMRIEGVAKGELSDQDVIQFVDRIRTEPRFAPWLGSVKLQGLQRSTHGVEGEPERTFRLDAAAKERLIK